MSRFCRLGHQLYTGEVSYDFIGHRRRWYIVSAILITCRSWLCWSAA